MLNLLSETEIICLFCIVLSIAVACILFFYQSEKNGSIRILALSYLSMTFAFLMLFLLKTGLITNVPHLYRTSYVFALLYMPLSFLYIRSAITSKRVNKWDALHFLPALVYILDYTHFFLLPASEKLEMLNAAAVNNQMFFQFDDGSLFDGQFYVMLIGVSSISYWIAQWGLVIGMFRDLSSGIREQNRDFSKWIIFYNTVQLLIFLPIYLIFLIKDREYFFRFSYAFSIVCSAFSCFSLFIHPHFLFARSSSKKSSEVMDGTPSKIPVADSLLAETVQAEHHSLTNHNGHTNGNGVHLAKPLQNLTKKQISKMKFEVESLLERQQPYLQHGYSLQEMANTLGYPLYQLSALINQEWGTNFNKLINKYRIGYAIKLYNEGKVPNLNINGLASECGFNNRNSFTTAFKDLLGLTPSEYFKTHVRK